MEKESKKPVITRAKIVEALIRGSKHMAIIWFTVALLSLPLFLIFTAITEYHIAAILILGALPLTFTLLCVLNIVEMLRYRTDKLIIVEDKLYKTIPYEKINRMASSKYTRNYDHGLYFKEYGKYTVTSTSFSIDFEGDSDYYLVVFNSKKPKIINIYKKSEVEYKQ